MMSTIKFIVYNSDTGKVVRAGVCQDHMVDAQKRDGELVISDLAIDQLTQYINVIELSVIDRPEQTITQDEINISADGIEKSTFSNVEIGSEVFIDDVSQGIENDGTTELTFDTIGTYKIKFVLFPFIDAEFIVNAN